MPARTGNTTYVPGVGATTRGKSGKAKTFQGTGPAPSGTTKEPEATYLTAPTITVSGGTVEASGYDSQRAAKRAVRATRKRQARRQAKRERQQKQQAARTYLQRSQTRRRRERATTEKRVKQTERAVKTTRPEPRPAAKAVKAPRSTGPSLPSQKAAPKRPKAPGFVPKNPAQAKISSVPGRNPNLKGTPVQRKAARAKVQRTKKVLAQSRRPAPLPGLDAEGQRVARTVLKTGKRMGASKKELMAAVETGLVETSGFHNLPGGDADSAGWRQERTSLFGTDAFHPKKGAKNFFTETKQQPGATAGELAANVQRPAEEYRGRYQERRPEAAKILKAFEQGEPNPKAAKRYKIARKEAKELGLKVASDGKAEVGPPPKKVVTRYKAIKASAKALEKLNVPYVYGGGHNGGMPDPSEGLDCSSSTVYLLNKAGVKTPNIVSGEFGNHFPSGPGAVTIFYNPGHVFLRIGEKYYGTSVGDGGSGGLGYHGAPSADYLSQYNVAHVPGLGKKQALQLDIKPVEGSAIPSAPGVSFSPSGTTATVSQSEAVTKEKAGPSSKPIRLTTAQRVGRTKAKLKQLGVGEETPAPETSPTLEALEAKYLRAA